MDLARDAPLSTNWDTQPFYCRSMYSPVTKKDVQSGVFQEVVYAVSSMQGWRPEQEDSHLIKQAFPVNANGIFGVFDGHGGKFASHFMKNRLINVMKRLTSSKSTAEVASERYFADLISDSFLEIDQSIFDEAKTAAEKYAGTTACVCIYNENKFVTGWVGDSRVVLCRKAKAILLTTHDHKPSLKSEKRRIEENGGTVSNGRVNGILAVSRSLGDFNFKDLSKPPKNFIVSAIPEIVEQERDDTEDEFLLLACDGIWDVMSAQQACNFVRTRLRSKIRGRGKINVEIVENVVSQLLDECLKMGSKDNMTALLVVFEDSISLRRTGNITSSMACDVL